MTQVSQTFDYCPGSWCALQYLACHMIWAPCLRLGAEHCVVKQAWNLASS